MVVKKRRNKDLAAWKISRTVKEMEFYVWDYVAYNDTIPTLMSHQTIINYWPFINDIKGRNNHLNFHVSAIVEDLKSNLLHNHLQIKRNQKSMYVSYPLDLRKVLIKFSNDIPNAIDAVVPLASQLAEDKINTIEVIVKYYNLSVFRCLDMLRSALNTYSRLNLLKFSCNMHNGREYHVQFGSNIEDCSTFDIDTTLNRPTTIPSEKSLRYIYLKNAVLETPYLKTISDLLPNTKILKLVDCEVEKYGSSNVAIDVEGMHSLDQLILYIKFLVQNKDCQYIVIRVDQLAQNRTNYYKWKKPSDKKLRSVEFLPADAKFLSNYKSFNSPRVTCIIIMCQQIDEINICLQKDDIAATLYPNLM